MLLRFQVSNYKSFADEAVFSMIPFPRMKGLDYSLINKKYNSKSIKALSTSVIYGPNAAGKSNIIGAMDTLRTIVLQGHIRNNEIFNFSPNYASSMLELIPNKMNQHEKPVKFLIEFFEKGYKICYSLSIEVGLFLSKNNKRNILEENLYINDNLIFERGDSLKLKYNPELHTFYSENVQKDFNVMKNFAITSLDSEELFLMNGFKLVVSRDIADLIQNWFVNKFMVIYKADSMQLINRFADSQKKGFYVETTINDAAKIFGINSNDIGYVVKGDGSEPQLSSKFTLNDGKDSVAIPAEIFESYGTLRFVNIFPVVLRAIQTGGTLIVDEFDASIHPMALINIINIFHNDDINIRNAQLIFNTHNPIFLNANFFRRDEIKFVDRADTTHTSSLYSLAEFGTSGNNGVRSGEDYMKNYFINKYGAVKDIDFSPIFEKMITYKEDMNDEKN